MAGPLASPLPASTAPTERVGFATAQVHAGQEPDTAHGSRITPLYLSNGFVFHDFADARDRFSGEAEGYTYTRLGNPTNAAVERKLAALEGGAEALVVSSGQAAVAVALLSILSAGDRILSARSIYEGTRGLLRDNLARFGIAVDFVDDANDPEAWRRLIRPSTRVLFGEGIPNPRNDVLDIPAVAGVARQHGLPLVIDSTLATPYLSRPIELGADIVVHSTSKFLAGHGSSVGGAVVDAGTFDWGADAGRFPHLTRPEPALGGRSYAEAHGRQAFAVYARTVVAARFGPTMSPFTAFLLQQGIETLSLRVERHSSNALSVARWLERQPEVASVDYAGLESSPFHELATRDLPLGTGSVFAFTLLGGEDAAAAFLGGVELFSRMTHLGDVRSLVLHPASTSHAQLTEAERDAAGVGPGMLRLSVGIEDVDDLIRDLERGLRAAGDAARDAARHDPPDAEHLVHQHLLRTAAIG